MEVRVGVVVNERETQRLNLLYLMIKALYSESRTISI